MWGSCDSENKSLREHPLGAFFQDQHCQTSPSRPQEACERKARPGSPSTRPVVRSYCNLHHSLFFCIKSEEIVGYYRRGKGHWKRRRSGFYFFPVCTASFMWKLHINNDDNLWGPFQVGAVTLPAPMQSHLHSRAFVLGALLGRLHPLRLQRKQGLGWETWLELLQLLRARQVLQQAVLALQLVILFSQLLDLFFQDLHFLPDRVHQVVLHKILGEKRKRGDLLFSLPVTFITTVGGVSKAKFPCLKLGLINAFGELALRRSATRYMTECHFLSRSDVCLFVCYTIIWRSWHVREYLQSAWAF